MQIAKKAALLAATAGTLALLGTGTAAANGYGGSADRSGDVPTTFNLSSFIFQSTDCDTATGTTAVTSAAAPTGDVSIGSTCINAIGG
ncbi:hypothetical protein [Streptomyces sp. OE57]|uniref:hypothetical protein n=1 Tax=Streptomyces lacaronensis TaxID=3379885 RepID=UPI0039B73490